MLTLPKERLFVRCDAQNLRELLARCEVQNERRCEEFKFKLICIVRSLKSVEIDSNES